MQITNFLHQGIHRIWLFRLLIKHIWSENRRGCKNRSNNKFVISTKYMKLKSPKKQNSEITILFVRLFKNSMRFMYQCLISIVKKYPNKIQTSSTNVREPINT